MMFVPDRPGIYEDLSYEQYDAIKAVRRSRVSDGKRSMAHYRWAEDHGSGESTEALAFGQALHAAVLEPDRFERDVVLGAINPKTGEPFGIDTKAQQEFIAANPGAIVIGKNFREKIVGMSAAIRNHPRAGVLVRACTRTEVVLVWEDPASGVLCKARLDGVSTSLGMIDLKSTTDASPEAFPRSVYSFDYHIQAAMSIDGWMAVIESPLPFTMIAVEKEAPYELTLQTVTPGAIAHDIGKIEYQAVLHAIANARKTGVWPGYPVDAFEMELPKWVLQRFHDAA